MAENERVLRAAEVLVFRELLVPERDPRLADVAVDGRGFRYAAAFWERAGVRATDAVGEEDRLAVAVEWVSAGAPLWWARTEADRALARRVSSDGSRRSGEGPCASSRDAWRGRLVGALP